MNTIDKVKLFIRDINKWSFATLFLCFSLVLPLFAVSFNLFYGAGEMWQHVVDHLLFYYVSNSLLLILGTSAICIFLGVSCGWIISRYEFGYRKIIEWLLFFPLAIPSYIVAYAYVGFFEHGGFWEIFWKTLNIDFPKIDMMNIGGLIWVLSFSLFPYVYASVRIAFLSQSQSLQDASALLGASKKNTFSTLLYHLLNRLLSGGYSW